MLEGLQRFCAHIHECISPFLAGQSLDLWRERPLFKEKALHIPH